MLDEKKLVSEILDGNEYAFRQLVRQYERMVFYVISKLINDSQDVEDLAQEVFMKVFKNLSKFKHQSKLSTWIGQIAYREALNYIQKHKQKNHLTSELEEGRYLMDQLQTPDQLLNSNNISQIVQNMIQKLPEHYRQVLVLFHLDEFSYPEICEITGMPEGTVKNYIFRARQMLKEYLQPLINAEQI